jgi:hypothetical protein
MQLLNVRASIVCATEYQAPYECHPMIGCNECGRLVNVCELELRVQMLEQALQQVSDREEALLARVSHQPGML